MGTHRYQRVLPYGVAIGSTTIALLITLWLTPHLSITLLAFFYLAVVLTSWFGGISPGIVAIGLSSLFINYFFTPPLYSLTMADSTGLIRLIVFIIIASIISFLNDNLRTSQRRIAQLNQQLQTENDQKLNTFLESISDAFVSLDPEWRYVYVNHRAGQLFNRRPEDLVGKNIWEEFPEGVGQPFYHAYYRAIAEQQSIQLEEYYAPWDRWFENRIYPTPTGLNIFFQEITDRKRAEIALRQSEEQLRQILENMPVMLDAFDEDWNVIVWNHECERVTGYSAAEVTYNPTILEQLYPDAAYRDRMFAEWQQQGNQYRNWEWDVTCKDGSIRTIAWSSIANSFPVRGWAGWGIGVDVTERKQAEAAIRQLNAELEQRVADRTAELMQVNDRLSRSLAELQRLQQETADLYNRAPCGYHSLDATGMIVRINDTELDWLGYTRDEVIHKQNFSELLTPTSQAVFAQNFPIFMQQGWINNLEFELVSKNGSTRWINVNATAIKDEDGQFIMSRSTLFDISARKQTESALQESEERFRRAFEDAAIGMALVSINGYWLRVNRALCEIIGYSSSELLQTDFQSITHPDDLATDLNYVQQLLKGEIRTYQMEKRYFHKHGHIVWILLSVSLVRDSQQRSLYFISQIQNISDRKRAEEILSRYERITAITPDGIALIDRHYVYQIANQVYLNWFNKSESEVIGQSVRSIVGADLFDSFIQPKLDQCLAGEVIRYERWADYSVSGHKFLSVTYAPYRDLNDVISGVLVSIRDLTNLKQAEVALAASETKFRSLTESSPIGIFMMDRAGNDIYTNPRAQEICGYTFEEASGQGWQRFIHPADLQAILQDWAENPPKEHPKVYNEVRYIYADGTVHHYGKVQVVPLFDPNRMLIGYMGTIEDITQQREIDRMKNEFISIVSHELRTPLTALRGSLGLVMQGVYDQKPDKKQRMIEIAAQQSDRLVRLVNDILDLQRLESGRVKLNLQVCHIATLMQQSIEVMQSYAKEHQVELVIYPLETVIWASPDAIVQTLTNLLSNAIKFSQPGGTVWLQAEIDEKMTTHVLFSVKDQGRGIPANKLETIFERFQQVDASDSREKGGTGLGLAICRRIVQQHGGRIWAESVLGEGSTFYLTLPLSQIHSPE
jgi:PAS domain S-box-containing protein